LGAAIALEWLFCTEVPHGSRIRDCRFDPPIRGGHSVHIDGSFSRLIGLEHGRMTGIQSVSVILGVRVSGEVALAAEVVPVAMTAIGMYGQAVLAKAWDDVADVTIKAGMRVLQRVFGLKKEGEALPGVLADVVAHPDDSDVVAQFRLTIRRALEADSALVKEVAAIMAEAAPAGAVSQRVTAGRDAYTAGRDMKITQRPD
jgi:hypothetical protein